MSKMNLLLKPTLHGERAFPIDRAELDRMLIRGEIVQVSRNPLVYRFKPESETQPQVYATRDMVAQPGVRRGRPPTRVVA